MTDYPRTTLADLKLAAPPGRDGAAQAAPDHLVLLGRIADSLESIKSLLSAKDPA